MAITKDFYDQAQLALASYSSLSTELRSDAYLIALNQRGQGLSDSQAAIFASTHIVKRQ